MKRLAPLLLGIALAGLALAVGAVFGYFTLAGLQFAYAFVAARWTNTDDFASFWVYRIPPLAGPAVGAAAGIALGLWLTRRLLAARRE
jgi:hypothetical protein